MYGEALFPKLACWGISSRGGQGNLAQLWEELVGEAGGLKGKDQGECGLQVVGHRCTPWAISKEGM